MENKPTDVDSIEKVLSSLFREAVHAWKNQPKIPRPGALFSFGKTVYFYTNELEEKALIWATRALKGMPASKQVKNNLISILNEKIYEIVIAGDQSEKTFKEALSKALGSYKLLKCSYIAPCKSFAFDNDEMEFRHPIISIVRAETAIERLRLRDYYDQASLDAKAFFKQEIDKQNEHKHYWIIETNSTRKTAHAEAKVCADVFMAFFRLRVKYDKSGITPRIGDVEVDSISHSNNSFFYSTLQDGKPSLASQHTPFLYQVGYSSLQSLNAESNQLQLSTLLEQKRNTLAERIFNALAWYTKGRQAHDSSERLVLFFTALEAGLSTEAADGSIAEKIARNVGVVIDDGAKQRQNIYRDIKRLYSIRSKLIHTGRRSASDMDARRVEFYTELFLFKILEKWNLSMQYSSFQSELLSLSFGFQKDL